MKRAQAAFLIVIAFVALVGCGNKAARIVQDKIRIHDEWLGALEKYCQSDKEVDDAVKSLVLERIKETGEPPAPYRPWPPDAIPRQPRLDRIQNVCDIPIPELSGIALAAKLPMRPNADYRDLAFQHNQLVDRVERAGQEVVKKVNQMAEKRNKRLLAALEKWKAREDGAAPPMQPKVRIVRVNSEKCEYQGEGESVLLVLELKNEGEGPAHKVSVLIRDEERDPAWADSMPAPSASADWLEPKALQALRIPIQLPADVARAQGKSLLLNCRVRDGWHCTMDEVLFWLHLPSDKPRVEKIWRKRGQ